MALTVHLPYTFRLVYQGGHHNVYCNTAHHFKSRGGSCHSDVDRKNLVPLRYTAPLLTKCDCHKWGD